jgi:hypothetical protein
MSYPLLVETAARMLVIENILQKKNWHVIYWPQFACQFISVHDRETPSPVLENYKSTKAQINYNNPLVI